MTRPANTVIAGTSPQLQGIVEKIELISWLIKITSDREAENEYLMEVHSIKTSLNPRNSNLF